ncbi:MAG: DNA/RNA non-specific endonuclease [Acidobacteria bacterium]|nr:DNA/RNA non-specific endonuclease [Acidobacteriota bacterium]
MNNKTLVGAIIALVILLSVIFFCFWLGKSIYNRISGGGSEPAASQPANQPSGPSNQPANAEQAKQIYLAPGAPSNCGTSDPNNYMLVNNYMVICYNRDKGIPNWVAWRVSKADLGSLDREDAFRPDDRLPNGWPRITPSDYTGSGFDRGHVCPNADRYGSREAADSTFVMTNMTPQTGDLNRGPWQKLEGYLRSLVTRGSDVYIVAGVYGEKGKLKKKVSIPTNDWKIAVVVPAGAPISAVNEKTRVIAVDMPNVNGIKNADWQTYRTTVRQIEQATGYNFLSALPQNVQDALETKADTINN